jgi:hypothetical protein
VRRFRFDLAVGVGPSVRGIGKPLAPDADPVALGGRLVQYLPMSEQPGRPDVDLLLKIMDLYLSEPLRKARNFWRTIPDGLTFAELEEKFPRGTEGFEHIDTVLIFWETVGALLKKGLLSEELAFDTFLDVPPWNKIEAAARSLREERQDPRELENLEYAYRRSVEWKTRSLGRRGETGPD